MAIVHDLDKSINPKGTQDQVMVLIMKILEAYRIEDAIQVIEHLGEIFVVRKDGKAIKLALSIISTDDPDFEKIRAILPDELQRSKKPRIFKSESGWD